MRYSHLFGKSVRDVSADVKSKGHEYLLRGGFLRESSAGRFYTLPLGLRVQERICTVVEEEMNTLGAQKMYAPILHPRELWEETKRTESVSFELMQVTDRSRRRFVLGGTAEEMMVAVVRQFALSERDLPFCIYQFSTKFRDELRARGGLLRGREFMMKDGYSFHTSREDFESYYTRMSAAYSRIFERLDVPALSVAADNGYMGGEYCHEFIVEHPLGESRYLVSEDGQYCAHEDIATFARENMNSDERVADLAVRDAARGISIQAGVSFYGQPSWRQIKSIVYFTDAEEPVLVSLRGDLEINELKLQRVLNCNGLRMATEEEVSRLGSVVGFVSPRKLEVRRVGDLSLTTVRNFITGADEWQKDTVNVNYGRDFTMDTLADIALAAEGHRAAHGNSLLREHRGIEVGNIFQLGTWYSERMKGAQFTAGDGEKRPYYMGCYGIGISRTLATIAETHNDDAGLAWPKTTTPYAYHLVSVGKDAEVNSHAEGLYERLTQRGMQVLYDDRRVSNGVKFSDADLIGIEHRLVISKRHAGQGTVELRHRASGIQRDVAVEVLLR